MLTMDVLFATFAQTIFMSPRQFRILSLFQIIERDLDAGSDMCGSENSCPLVCLLDKTMLSILLAMATLFDLIEEKPAKIKDAAAWVHPP
ncbi:unnamed protein product [Urochloa humidicola]